MDGNERVDLGRELDRYRRALRYLAGTCAWDAFHAKAAQLFDYLEPTGVTLLKQRLHMIVAGVVIGLVAVFAVFSALGSAGIPFFSEHRDAVALLILAVYLCELLLLLEMRLYLSLRSSRRSKREAEFVGGLEKVAREALGPDACPLPGA